ncbi:MAG: hypothetical protein D4S02_04310 [Rhodocyclaceae bacterium]|nr:MAG: hypothetical protein D4S02_04310 [Rhodocyclaceae bacterium]
MMLPPLNSTGDLPPGIHRTAWDEIEHRFGKGARRRSRALAKLRHLHELAARTGALERFLIFGSFVSSKAEPRDVDIVLVMKNEFRLEDAPRESRTLFSHPDAEARFGASVFWVRQGMFPDELMKEFLETWQIKRDGSQRGLLEVEP